MGFFNLFNNKRIEGKPESKLLSSIKTQKIVSVLSLLFAVSVTYIGLQFRYNHRPAKYTPPSESND